MAGAAGLEPVTSAVTGQRSNQLSYAPAMGKADIIETMPQRQVFGFKSLGRATGGKKYPGSRRQGGGGGEPR